MDFCGGTPLWNTNLIWNNSWPEFTDCFQNTILIPIPSLWLWITAIPFLVCLPKAGPGARLPTSAVSILKPAISLVLACLQIAQVFAGTTSGITSLPFITVFYFVRVVDVISLLMAAMFSRLCTSRGVTTSGVLFIFWLLQTAINIIPLYTYFIKQVYIADPFLFYVFVIQYPLILTQFLLHCFAEKKYSLKPIDEEYKEKPPCPETEASFLSRLVFGWMTKLIVLGFRKPLVEDDLWQLHPQDRCQNVLSQFEAVWTQARKRYDDMNAQSKYLSLQSSHEPMETMPLLSRSLDYNTSPYDGPSLAKVLFKAFHPDLLKAYACKAVSDVLQFVSPLLLSALITHTEEESDYKWKGYVLSAGLFIFAFTQSVFYHQHFHFTMTLGMRIRTALMAAIYKKALFLNSESGRTSTVGEIVNLMAVDCQRILDMISYTWMAWSIPLQATLAIYLIWNRMGPPVIAGLLVLIFLLPVNAYIAYKQQQLQRQNLVHKDSRIKMLNEVLNGIKVLKLYAWEPSFKKKIMKIRESELKILKKIAYIKGFSTFVWTCAPYMVTLATFAAYVLTSDVHLNAEMAFVTLSLFNILQFPINFIPEFISFSAQASVSVRRIGQFLTSGELNPDLIGRNPETSKISSDFRLSGSVAMCSKNYTAKNAPRFFLMLAFFSINLNVLEGELVAVAGQVGAGKSSLLSAILGDMDVTHGQVNRKGKIAYVPQQAWLQNATVRDNILFGSPMNEKRYKKVIEACALKDDLQMLPAGDMTEIGEKGINLSGGQKQRISLARAVYSNADIYLLDDPLSAVDSHVGKHIFKKVISNKGLLRYKTRVFVTHDVHWLALVDTVIVLSEGRITECGSYSQMMAHDGPFAQFLKFYFSNDGMDTNNHEDPEVLELRERMWEHVESVTSASEGATSGEDRPSRRPRTKKASTTVKRHGISPLRLSSDTKAGKLIEGETPETGKVKMSVFGSYIQAVGVAASVVIILLFAGYQAASVGANVWLSYWTQDGPSPNSTNIQGLPVDKYYLTVYGLFGCIQAFFILMYAFFASIRMVRAARKLHTAMLDRTIRSPMSFFDTTPIGRIVNRFSRDVETIDNNLPRIVFMYVTTVFSTLSTLVVISINTPLFLTVVIPLAGCYYMIQRFFVPSSRQLKRLQATSRSPIFSHFGESISGASCIRAFGATDRFMQESVAKMDKNQIFYFAAICANRWLGIWIEFVSSCVVFAASVFSIMTPGVTGGQVGLSITYALQITQSLKWLVRTLSDLETNIVSVERVKEYSELQTEANWINPLYRPSRDWPQAGHLQFQLYTTRYRPGLDLVLKGITCDIKPGEKVGIVGRTGAGKSSLSMALFRLVEAVGGRIVLDGLVLEDMGLHDVRSRITILPQDPVLFSGTLRMNLDPFLSYQDHAIWRALKLTHMKQFVSGQPDGLEFQCGEGGSNLSVGQRQLVCLARALLRKSKVLVLDEATAAVDLETDNLIQQTIRAEFAYCTVLTIAHRLHTILDYDRILVMNAGTIQEFDHPHVLLSDTSSAFYSLARNAGIV